MTTHLQGPAFDGPDQAEALPLASSWVPSTILLMGPPFASAGPSMRYRC